MLQGDVGHSFIPGEVLVNAEHPAPKLHPVARADLFQRLHHGQGVIGHGNLKSIVVVLFLVKPAGIDQLAEEEVGPLPDTLHRKLPTTITAAAAATTIITTTATTGATTNTTTTIIILRPLLQLHTFQVLAEKIDYRFPGKGINGTAVLLVHQEEKPRMEFLQRAGQHGKKIFRYLLEKRDLVSVII